MSRTRTVTMAFLRAKFEMARHAVVSVRHESKLKIAVILVATVFLWVGAFAAFRQGFVWLRGLDLVAGRDVVSLGDIVMLRLLSVFALALFFMLIFSNVLIAFSTLYRSREVAFFMQAPIPFSHLFVMRFVECVVFSSWASAYLGSPLILAYGLTTGAPWSFYVAAILCYVPFVTIPAALGALVTLVLVGVYPHLPRGTLVAAAIGAMAVLFLYFRTALGAEDLPGDTFLVDSRLRALLAVTSQTQAPWLPSQWAAQGMLLTTAGRLNESAFYVLLLLSNALFFTWVAATVAHRIFYPGWSALESSSHSLPSPSARGTLLGRLGLSPRFPLAGPLVRLLEIVLRVLPEPVRSLAVKDVKLFWRDPTQWTQFIIFFGIMMVYVATLRSPQGEVHAHYRSWIASMNIAACTLILATLTSRFVFPLVSLEGRRFWVLGLAPITMRQLVRQKFWLSVATTSGFSIGLVVLSCIQLEVEPIPFVLAVYSITVTNFGLAGLAVGLGSLYPNFHEDNPARIVSGMGGTLNFLLSMAYIALIVGAETVILQWRALNVFARPERLWCAIGGVVTSVTVLSVLCTLLPMRVGLKNLQKAEF